MNFIDGAETVDLIPLNLNSKFNKKLCGTQRSLRALRYRSSSKMREQS